MPLLNNTLGEFAQRRDRSMGSSWQKAGVKETAPLQNVKALIAEKALASSKVIKDELSSLGVEHIDTVNSANDMVNALRDGKYGLVFVDYALDEDKPDGVLFEEMSHRQMVPPPCCFIALTDDSFGSSIITMAESRPDDILLKPFSAEHIARRTLRAYRRKQGVNRLLHAMQQQEIRLVESAYHDITIELPKYERYAKRLLVEAHMKFGSVKRAQGLILDLLKERSDAKMETMMAEIYLRTKKMEEAEQWLRKCTNRNESYLPAFDALAELLWTRGAKEEALSLLEQLGVSAHNNAKRLRMMADLSEELGDTVKFKNYLSRVISRTYGTSLASEDDFYRTAEMLFQQKKSEEAMALESRIRRVSSRGDERDIPNLVLLTKNFLHQENRGKANETLDIITGRNDYVLTDLSAGTLLAIVELCFRCDQKNTAMRYAKALMKKNLSRGMKERLKRLISAIDPSEMDQEVSD